MSEEEDGDTTRPVAAATSTTVHVGLHGTAPVFDSTQEEWPEYAERLDSYFLASDLNDPVKKRAILVNAVGPKTYRLIKTLCLPEKPQNHSFEEIVKRVKNHFHPKPSAIMRRYDFNERKQKPGESVADRVSRCDSRDCNCRRLRVRSRTRGHATRSARVRYR